MHIIVHANGANLIASEENRMIEKFESVLNDRLGGARQAMDAYRAYNQALEKHCEIPLPEGATESERAAVARWEDAEAAATKAAIAEVFAGLGRDHPYFEILVG